jgi:hypothetical protein
MFDVFFFLQISQPKRFMYFSFPHICHTPSPSYHPHLIYTNNIWSGANIMKIITKQIFPSSCHFLRIRIKYLPHHPILDYLRPPFVRQPGRPSFTPICNMRRNYNSLTKRSPEKYVWNCYLLIKKNWCKKFNHFKLKFNIQCAFCI